MKVFIWFDSIKMAYCAFANTEEEARQNLFGIYLISEETPLTKEKNDAVRYILNRPAGAVRPVPKCIVLSDYHNTPWYS